MRPGRLRDPAVHVVLACALVFAPTLLALSGCEYLLVNDLRSYQVGMPESGLVVGVPDHLLGQDVDWGPKLWRNLVDPTSHAAWLYRPFPDLMEWFLSSVFRGLPGVWHAAILGLRVCTVALTWRLTRRMGVTAAGAAVASLYVAFFPAIPEVHLLNVESWVAPPLLLTVTAIAGLEGDSPAAPSRQLVATGAVAFVLLTMAKEALAPLTVLLLVAFASASNRPRARGLVPGWVLAGMALFAANQSVRFVLAVRQPYAQGGSGEGGIGETFGRIPPGLGRAAGELFLVTSNALPVAAAAAALALLGAASLVGTLRGRSPGARTAAAMLGGQVVCLGLASAAPYAALRYLYPSGLLLAPLLGVGLDRLTGRPLLDRLRGPVYALVVVGLTAFGGACVLAQALALAASSRADWAMLSYAARGYDAGASVIVLDDGGSTERAHWIECELKNLRMCDGRAGTQGGRFEFVPGGGPLPADLRGCIVLGSNPGSLPDLAAPGSAPAVPPAAATVRRFGSGPSAGTFRALAAFRRRARFVNPWFQFPKDAGSTRFPGHAWEVVETR